MAVLVDESERRLVPAWKSFTNSTPELQPLSSIELEKADIGSYVTDWKSTPNIANAGDLLSAAIVGNRLDVPEVYEAAQFIVCQHESIPQPLLKKANDIIGTSSPTFETPFLTNDYSILKRIADLKRLINLYPKDAILQIEIARCYLSLGQLVKADLHVRYALALDCNNRYIVRCAARFYLHIQQLDVALLVVRKSRLTSQDPWLMASEISLSQLNNKTSRYIKKGLQLIESGKFGKFDLTELRSAIGTEELRNGAYAKCRKLLNDSLIQPNSNSLAQARWISASKSVELNFDRFDLSTGQFVEARSYKAVEDKDYVSAIKFAEKWIEVEPYSTRTILYAYNIASNYLKDNNKGIEILSNAYKTHKSNPVILNDYAYSLALNGQTERAQEVIRKAKTDGSRDSDIIDICITATKGLIAFRTGDADTGSRLYQDAIERSMKHSDRPSLNHSALLNYCRELLVYSNTVECREVVTNIIDKIPLDQSNAELVKLKDEVDSLLTKNELILE